MTITCRKCNTKLSNEALYCFECGAPISDDPPAAASKQDIDALLTDANLHRIRGEWEEAIKCCTEVLRQDTENPEAHALLGDIYASQSRFEDAIRWFEMAIDIEPDNQAYADKLEELILKLAEMNAAPGSDSSRTGWFDKFVVGQSFESSVRVITVSSAAFAALLIIVAVVIMLSRRLPDNDIYTPVQPTTTASSRPAHSPVIVPRTTEPAIPTERSAYEDWLLAQLRNNELVASRRITVDDARYDPRNQTLIATFRNSQDSVDRPQILLNAGAVAAAGFATKDVSLVTVRCVGAEPVDVGRAQLGIVFVGDIDRRSAGALQPNASAEQISPVIQNPWWSRTVK